MVYLSEQDFLTYGIKTPSLSSLLLASIREEGASIISQDPITIRVMNLSKVKQASRKYMREVFQKNTVCDGRHWNKSLKNRWFDGWEGRKDAPFELTAKVIYIHNSHK